MTAPDFTKPLGDEEERRLVMRDGIRDMKRARELAEECFLAAQIPEGGFVDERERWTKEALAKIEGLISSRLPAPAPSVADAVERLANLCEEVEANPAGSWDAYSAYKLGARACASLVRADAARLLSGLLGARGTCENEVKREAWNEAVAALEKVGYGYSAGIIRRTLLPTLPPEDQHGS